MSASVDERTMAEELEHLDWELPCDNPAHDTPAVVIAWGKNPAPCGCVVPTDTVFFCRSCWDHWRALQRVRCPACGWLGPFLALVRRWEYL